MIPASEVQALAAIVSAPAIAMALAWLTHEIATARRLWKSQIDTRPNQS